MQNDECRVQNEDKGEIPMDVDWSASEQELYDGSVAAIQRFASERPECSLCCFFFDSDEPRYGSVAISFDTFENNLRFSEEHERRTVERRLKSLTGKLTWQWAKYQLSSPSLAPMNTNSGDFAFLEYARVDFPAWRELAEQGNYPKGAEHQDDFLESSGRLVCWRVIERLVADDAFQPLNLATPFLVGYSMHDQEESILRILNWPVST